MLGMKIVVRLAHSGMFFGVDTAPEWGTPLSSIEQHQFNQSVLARPAIIIPGSKK
jgi:hypothetical protein